MNSSNVVFCRQLAEMLLRKSFSNPYNNNNGGFGVNGAIEHAVGAPRLGSGMSMHLGASLRGSTMGRGGGGMRSFGASANPLGRQNPGVGPDYQLHQRSISYQPAWMKAYRQKYAPKPANLGAPSPGKTSSNGFV